MKKSLVQKVIIFLKGTPKQKFNAIQIADNLISTYVEEFQKKSIALEKRNKVLNSQVAAEINAQIKNLVKKDNHIFWKDKPKPRFFWYDPDNINEFPQFPTSKKMQESDKLIKKININDITTFMKDILDGSYSILETEYQHFKYFLLNSEKGKILIPINPLPQDKNLKMFKIFENSLILRYDEENEKHILYKESKLTFKPDWKNILDDIFYCKFDSEKYIIYTNSVIQDSEILRLFVNKIQKSKEVIDETLLSELQLTNNQKEVVKFLSNNENSVTSLKLTLFCRQNNIQFPEILYHINGKSNHHYGKLLIIEEDRKCFVNDFFIKVISGNTNEFE